MKTELEQIRALTMELLGFNLPDEAVSKVYEIRDICTKKLKEEIDKEINREIENELYAKSRAAISHLFGSY